MDVLGRGVALEKLRKRLRMRWRERRKKNRSLTSRELLRPERDPASWPERGPGCEGGVWKGRPVSGSREIRIKLVHPECARDFHAFITSGPKAPPPPPRFSSRACGSSKGTPTIHEVYIRPVI